MVTINVHGNDGNVYGGTIPSAFMRAMLEIVIEHMRENELAHRDQQLPDDVMFVIGWNNAGEPIQYKWDEIVANRSILEQLLQWIDDVGFSGMFD